MAALPAWLVEEYRDQLGVVPVRLGRHGIPKQIFLGVRVDDAKIDFIAVFIRLAGSKQPKPPANKRRRKPAAKA